MQNVGADGLQKLIQSMIEGAGSSQGEAEQVSENLVKANLMGHDSHGVHQAHPDRGQLPDQGARRAGGAAGGVQGVRGHRGDQRGPGGHRLPQEVCPLLREIQV